MIDTFKELIANQFEAAFCTLNACIDRCPDTAWYAPVGETAFCQVSFHTLFYADFYLELNEESFRRQPFHQDNPQLFRDYEELEDRKPALLYDKPSIKTYLEHCRKKASAVIAAETVDTLKAPAGFKQRAFSRAELYVFTVRHIQNHAAQLNLRLGIDHNEDSVWVGSGWREV